MIPGDKHEPDECDAISTTLARIGDKWTLLVVELLADGPMRFNEMRRTIGSISQRMLTLTLRGLERDGLVTRSVTATVPARVDYALTPLGRSLLDVVNVVSRWADEHVPALHAARRAHDIMGQPPRAATAEFPRERIEGRDG